MLQLKARHCLSFALLHCFALFMLALPPHQSAQGLSTKPTQQEQVGSAPNEYVTSATCSSCHEDLLRQLARNPHQLFDFNLKKGWQWRSCEYRNQP